MSPMAFIVFELKACELQNHLSNHYATNVDIYQSWRFNLRSVFATTKDVIQLSFHLLSLP